MKSKYFLVFFLLLFILSHTILGFNIDWSEPNSLDQPASFFSVDLLPSPVDREEKKNGENANVVEFGAENGGIEVEAVKSNEIVVSIF